MTSLCGVFCLPVLWRRVLTACTNNYAGQSESGKSTILKQFQLFFAPKAFRVEAEAWRAVIHLNLVRSVNFILDLLPSAGTTTVSREALSMSPLSVRSSHSWSSSTLVQEYQDLERKASGKQATGLTVRSLHSRQDFPLIMSQLPLGM